MTKINWTRFIVAGLIATVILFLTDGVLHEHLLHEDWEAVYAQLGAHESHISHGIVVFYFLVFELGRGLIAIFLYVLLRPFTSAGPKTAILAALITWFAFSIAGPAQFIPLGFYSVTLWGKTTAFQLFTTILAALAGAALYRDAAPDAGSSRD